ncbi:Y-family DNA polymerase [Parapedobacter soli]|uniref:Y-family DNA polymerase n=1 Tax=Parapedobacter soli TaxID=416955 RepID=UPI00290571C6|nr:DNA polymerase Y family protein [Parapedobacter soli]
MMEMQKRYVSIWFRYLMTDRLTIRQPALKPIPFVLAAPQHGRMRITAANPLATAQGVHTGMATADAKAFMPDLLVVEDKPGIQEKLLNRLGVRCMCYTPIVAPDHPDGLIFDSSGCAHLWGGETAYLNTIITRLQNNGYHVQAALADTIGAAWAAAHYGQSSTIIKSGTQRDALSPLPPAALRIDGITVQRLHKLGLRTIGSFMDMPPSVLRRRFGNHLACRLRQALGHEDEALQPLHPPPLYEERLPCLDPIRTATGIEIALEKLVEPLCSRLARAGKGLRKATLVGYRVDGKIIQATIGTNRPTAYMKHILNLFSLKIPQLEPALGIELFVLKATAVEDLNLPQGTLWEGTPESEDLAIAQLLDKLAGKAGICTVSRFLPEENYWPERSFKPASTPTEKPTSEWLDDKPRPIRMLAKPEPVDVMAPIPDYPPMVFQYRGERHHIKKADGPERIERAWWLDSGEHRDYYCVEDDQGRRYWLFRLGHSEDSQPQQWFIHGFFA